MREAERERLAVAMGWTHAQRDEESGLLYPLEGVWTDGSGRTVALMNWNPFTNWEDWGVLAEWVRKQDWLSQVVIGQNMTYISHGQLLSEYKDFGGPLLEAFPLAVLAALDAMQETDRAKV